MLSAPSVITPTVDETMSNVEHIEKGIAALRTAMLDLDKMVIKLLDGIKTAKSYNPDEIVLTVEDGPDLIGLENAYRNRQAIYVTDILSIADQEGLRAEVTLMCRKPGS